MSLAQSVVFADPRERSVVSGLVKLVEASPDRPCLLQCKLRRAPSLLPLVSRRVCVCACGSNPRHHIRQASLSKKKLKRRKLKSNQCSGIPLRSYVCSPSAPQALHFPKPADSSRQRPGLVKVTGTAGVDQSGAVPQKQPEGADAGGRSCEQSAASDSTQADELPKPASVEMVPA